MVLIAWPPARWALPVAGAGLLALAAAGRLGDLLAALFAFDSLGGPATRQEVWLRAAAALHDFPLTGLGLGSFRALVPILYPYQEPGTSIPHAHNLWLQVGADLGAPGLSVVGALLIGVAWAGSQNARFSSQKDDAPVSATAWLALGGLAALAALLAHGLLDAVTWGTRAAPLAWAVLGLLAATAAPRVSPPAEVE
jgi:putative inorganic carbon (HCO3(-)) transporter